jgi:hypothetical protein
LEGLFRVLVVGEVYPVESAGPGSSGDSEEGKAPIRGGIYLAAHFIANGEVIPAKSGIGEEEGEIFCGGVREEA